MSTDDPAYRDPLGIHARHLLTCRTLWYDWQRPEAGFGVAGICTRVEPPDGATFPQVFSRFFVYFQLWGDPGEYRLRLRLVRLPGEGDTGEEIHLGEDGEPLEFPAPDKPPITVLVSGLDFVEEYTLPIGSVPFPKSGVYEYQLWIEGGDEPIAREQVLARGVNDE